MHAAYLPNGAKFWECRTPGCGLSTRSEAKATEHSLECGTTKQQAAGQMLGLRGDLEASLAAYKKQVEQEFAASVVGLLELVAEAREQASGTAGTMEEALDAGAQAQALREFIPSVKVMADLPLVE